MDITEMYSHSTYDHVCLTPDLVVIISVLKELRTVIMLNKVFFESMDTMRI